MYTYGDSNWKDKLTKYNGTDLSYDTQGNLTSDGTRSYTWICGRQLRKVVSGSSTATYTYNHNGLRMLKYVEGTRQWSNRDASTVNIATRACNHAGPFQFLLALSSACGGASYIEKNYPHTTLSTRATAMHRRPFHLRSAG